MNFFKVLCASVLALTAHEVLHAQPRTWSFSRDTVYEWRSQGDSVFITNSGADSLRFDSVALELVQPVDSQYQILFHFHAPNTSGSTIILGYTSTGTRYISPANGPKGWNVAGGQSAKLWNFNGNYSVLTVNMKRSAIAAGDTVSVRLILMASASQGRDTLMILSTQDGPTSLQSRGPDRSGGFADGLYDMLGRRVEMRPQSARANDRPFLKPGPSDKH